MGRPRTKGNGQIVPRGNNKPAQSDEQGDDLRKLIFRMRKQIEAALPKHVSAERVARIAMTAVTANPKLAACSPGSFIACLLTAAQAGLEPNTPLGQCYLIPRKGHCTLQIGYQGWIDIAYRSGFVTGIAADVVREGDHFVWSKGLEPRLEHIPSSEANREEQPILFAYAVVRLRGSEPHFDVLSYAMIERRRLMNEAEKAGKFSPWRDHYAEMAKKTAIKAALKYAPKSVEMRTLDAVENAGEIGQPIDVVVDDKIAKALATEGLSFEELVPDAPAQVTSGSVETFAKAAGVTDLEKAQEMMAAGYEVDPNTGEVVPPETPAGEEKADG